MTLTRFISFEDQEKSTVHTATRLGGQGSSQSGATQEIPCLTVGLLLTTSGGATST